VTPSFVIDSSVAVAWHFIDERTFATDAIQESLVSEQAIVPEHWFLEVSNALLIGERRKRTTPAEISEFFEDLGRLLLQVDDQLAVRAFDHILPLSRAYRLTTYDAAYLDLAIRRHLPLASLDTDLRRAAKACGVKLLGK
jgi:predicted nucleic acid-binding protein